MLVLCLLKLTLKCTICLGKVSVSITMVEEIFSEALVFKITKKVIILGGKILTSVSDCEQVSFSQKQHWLLFNCLLRSCLTSISFSRMKAYVPFQPHIVCMVTVKSSFSLLLNYPYRKLS